MLAALEDAVERFDLDTAHLERVGLFASATMLSRDPYDVAVALMVQDGEQLLQELQKNPNDVALLSQLIIGWYAMVNLQSHFRINMDSVQLKPVPDIAMDWVHNWMENTEGSFNKTAKEQEIVHQKEKEMLESDEGRLTVKTIKNQFTQFIHNRV